MIAEIVLKLERFSFVLIGLVLLTCLNQCEFLQKKSAAPDAEFHEWLQSESLNIKIRHGSLHYTFQAEIKSDQLNELEVHQLKQDKQKQLLFKTNEIAPGPLQLVGGAYDPNQVDWLKEDGVSKVEYKIKITGKSGQQRILQTSTSFDNSIREQVIAAFGLHFNQKREFDGKTWRMLQNENKGSHIASEYIPEKSTDQSWTEILRINTMHGNFARENFKLLYLQRQRQYKDTCPAIQWKVLEENASLLIYSWSQSGCKSMPASIEIGRLVYTDNGIFKYVYQNKDSLTEDQVQNWVQILRELK